MSCFHILQFVLRPTKLPQSALETLEIKHSVELVETVVAQFDPGAKVIGSNTCKLRAIL